MVNYRRKSKKYSKRKISKVTHRKRYKKNKRRKRSKRSKRRMRGGSEQPAPPDVVAGRSVRDLILVDPRTELSGLKNSELLRRARDSGVDEALTDDAFGDGRGIDEARQILIDLIVTTGVGSGNLFDDSREVDVLRVIYGGDPGVINEELKSNQAEWEAYLKATEDSELESSTPPPIMEKNLLLIAGHGSVKESFTLIPRGRKLILSTATGTNLKISGGTIQLDSTYFRLYTGLVPDHGLDMELVYRDHLSGQLRRRGMQVNMRSAGVYIKHLTPQEEIVTEEKVFAGLNALPVEKGYNETSIFKSANNIEPSDPDLEEYATLLTDKNMDEIIPTEALKQSIKDKKSGKANSLRLSNVLKHIEVAARADEELPTNMFGWFCRGGSFNLNIDRLIRCNTEGLPALTSTYFSGDIGYAGVTSELRREKSLASKTKAQDFWEIYDKIRSNEHLFEEELEGVHARFTGIVAKIDSEEKDEHDVYKGISLSLDDVCLIFQMDNLLLINGI
jgi:hypothetical protein